VISKEWEKGFLKILSGKGKAQFFGKKVLRETCGKSNAGSKGKKELVMQINANNLYERKLL
jgi:hypothetical protein